jgi:hypothetical protein
MNNAAPSQTLQRALPSALWVRMTDRMGYAFQSHGRSDKRLRRKANTFSLFCGIIGVLACTPLLAEGTSPSAKNPGQAGVTLIKEPKYTSTPKYCVINLGTSGQVSVWMVEDGRRLFVDKNANGDLTDDGPPIEPSDVRAVGPNSWDFNYLLDAITPPDGLRHTRFDLRRWNYNEKEDNYGLSIFVDDQLPVYAGWFGTFWSAKRETAPVLNFGRTFTPRLLRTKEFTVGLRDQRLSVGFMNPGSGPGAESRLSIDALPVSVVPKLEIEWPVVDGGAPLRTSHTLPERCCYWEFYTTKFTVPKGVGPGKAKVRLELATEPKLIKLTTTEFELPVLAPTAEPQAER